MIGLRNILHFLPETESSGLPGTKSPATLFTSLVPSNAHSLLPRDRLHEIETAIRPLKDRNVAKPKACQYLVAPLRSGLTIQLGRFGFFAKKQGTVGRDDAVQRTFVASHSTISSRSSRSMPVRLACIRSLKSTVRIGAGSVVLTLILAPLAFGQNRPADTAEARPEDVAGQPGEKELPGNLLQGQEVPPEMDITKELLTEGDETEFRKKGGEQAFQNALKSTNPSDDEKKALDAAAKHYVYRFTLKKFREEETPVKKEPKGEQPKVAPPAGPKERLPDLRKSLLNSIRTYAKTPAAREYFLKSLTDRLAEILDNHFLVRLNAVLLLGQLQSDNGNPQKGIEPTPYVGAYVVLLKVIKDEKQHIVIKIVAVRGLTRICRGGFADPNDKRRSEIAIALAPELVKKTTHWWYQMALAESLGAAGVVYDPSNKQSPVILQVLAEAMADKNRHWQVRTEAARAIGYLPLDGNLNFAPVAYEMVNLGYQMSLAYNAKPGRDAWSNYYLNLYLAFKAPNANLKIAGGKRKPGLLEALPSSKEVKEAYEQVVLMTAHVLNGAGKQFSADQLKAVTSWQQSHVPGNDRITPGLPPIAPKDEPVKAEAAPADIKKLPAAAKNPEPAKS